MPLPQSAVWSASARIAELHAAGFRARSARRQRCASAGTDAARDDALPDDGRQPAKWWLPPLEDGVERALVERDGVEELVLREPVARRAHEHEQRRDEGGAVALEAGEVPA